MTSKLLAENYRQIFCKVIFFYSIFYIIMKLLAMMQGAWLDANLILCLPYVGFIIWGGFLLKRKKYSWIYIITGAIVVGAIRYFEKDLMLFLHYQL
ncbi:hypothetical protein [Zunongwangia sp. H14]|uniref:hypothetical protein n=1 Tax=Zunongwangia sp. H14 TaxID=3240792 RepID=UPI0035665A41